MTGIRLAAATYSSNIIYNGPEHWTDVLRALAAKPLVLVSWSLTSLFSTNMAISETDGHSL